MKQVLILLIIFYFFGCNDTTTDKVKKKSIDEIENEEWKKNAYQFFNDIIEKGDLDTTYGLDTCLGTIFNGRFTLDIINRYLPDTVSNEAYQEDTLKRSEISSEWDSTYFESIKASLYQIPDRYTLFLPDSYHPELELTHNEIDKIIDQNKYHKQISLVTFSKNFNQSNEKKWYRLSIPYFTKDYNHVFIEINECCPGLCGDGDIFIYSKVEGEWKRCSISSWIH